MSKFEFIQLHLIEKGVPKDLTKPCPFVCRNLLMVAGICYFTSLG